MLKMLLYLVVSTSREGNKILGTQNPGRKNSGYEFKEQKSTRDPMTSKRHGVRE